MIALDTWLLFAAACLALAVTPGPNLVYLVARTVAQGRRAGLVSLAGTASGFVFHVLAAALGLSALLAAVPYAYDAVRVAGAVYLAWLAWTTWKDAGKPAQEAVAPPVAARTLYRAGLTISLLNPKVALFQLALFPQFVDPSRGSVLAQSLVLGATQIAIVASFDALCVLAAADLKRRFTGASRWALWSKRLLAGVFGALAVRLVLESRR
ncbi:MAG: LysE family translocator [Burkholderiales bacterium]|jgi:threonine/homoserine/homoserine lactone efflux protein|nr:LysE family translocator [Burkholderiales bacterium]